MSYYQGGQYQQNPPSQGYRDQYGQYQPQPPPGQNGGYQSGAQSQPQSQYPGQPAYDQYGGAAGGGPVQQPGQGGYQDGYGSPRSSSFGGAYQAAPPQQQQQQQQYQYNPQHYAQSPQTPSQGQIASYNPAAYAQQPYAYTPPGNYSGATFPPQQPQQYQPSPPQPQGQFSHYTPPPPQHSYSSPPQRHHSQYAHQPPATSAPYPSEGLRPHAQSVSSMPVPQQPQPYQISPALPGLSDETWLPSPPQYQMNPEARQSPSPLYPSTSHTSLPSPPSSTPGPTPPAHGGYVSRSNTTDRHPQARPLPGPPDPDGEPDYFGNRTTSRTLRSQAEAERLSQEELFSQVEDAVYNAGSSTAGRGHSPSISVSRPPYETGSQPTPLFAPNSPHVHRNGSVTQNGHLSPALPEQPYSSDSDAEATQGLAMLQEAEQEDWRGSARFSSYGGESQTHSRTASQQQQSQAPAQQSAGAASDSEDWGGYDMSSFGGPDVQMSYGGNDPSELVTQQPLPMPASGDTNGYAAHNQAISSAHSSVRRSHASQSSHLSRSEYDYSMDSIHPFPPFNPAARVDASGTGGLSEPTGNGRRQSYDEGDEYTLTMEGQLPGRFPDEPPDIFFQQASTNYPSRPLPAVPGEDMPLLQTDIRGQPGHYPHAPDAFGMNAQGQWVPRSTSMISHQTTPQVTQPLRSKTDAEERRLRAQGLRGSYTPSIDATPNSSVIPDLPSLGAKRFLPGKLGAPDFKKCQEPWSLMGLLKWLLQIVSPEQYTELRELEVKEALVNLFTNKVATMNIADAEGLSNHVVSSMYKAGTLVPTEEWVKLVPGFMSGVMYQLTGSGCYSPTLHDHVLPGRCYSHHCQRTLKKVNLQALGGAQRGSDDWASFYHLKKENVEGKNPKELERQNQLHEIVYTEVDYVEQMNVLGTLYRDALNTAEPSIINPKRKEKFIRDVFGRIDAVKTANEDHLLPQLKYRQQEQGPWIVGFSDIFRQWIRKAKAAYLEYAGNFPGANFMFRQEIDRNLEFRAFIDRASKDKRSSRLQWDHFLKAPITRLQRYTLLLSTVLRNIRPELPGLAHLAEEKRNLQLAYDEVKAVTLECDTRVDEMQRKVDLSDLSMKLVLRPGMQTAVELNLDHIGRMLIHRGDLQRMGGNRFNWLDCHALLFDHYMVIAKTVAQRADGGGKAEKYDVSRLPIPMDLLILEGANDAAVQKSSYVKGITSVTTVSGRAGTPAESAGLGRTGSTNSPGPALQHVNTGASASSLQTVTSLGDGKDNDRIMYPFKIKHLGRDTYTLFAQTEQARREWVIKITEAKTKHAAALYAQHAEPFRLRVMADSAFVYDAFGLSGSQKGMVIKGTPVDRAVKEVEQRFKDTGRPGPICRARVNCATSFNLGGGQTQGEVRQMVAVGTEFGVFISEMDNPRGWAKSIPMVKVTQIAVLEEFNLFLLISDKSLIAYHLDVVCSNERAGPTTNDSARKAAQKLSGSRDVGLFAVGRQKDRTLVFYKKRENLNSVFKVLEPIYQKSSEKRRAAGLFKRGNYEFFREFDEFYIPTECTGMNLFHSSLAVSTARGFEVLTLDKKQPWSVPDLRAQEVQNIASHIKDQRALGMLRLSDQEFLLCYSNCAVYVNKHGEVSRSVIMDFVGNAQSAALYGPYLVLFDNDFVEIRNAQNGRLKQIIAGREIKCLDDGGSMSASGAANAATGAVGAPNGYTVNGMAGSTGGRTVKFVMQHPESERTQIVVELLLNENMKE